MLNWDDIVGETALEDFFTVPSLAKQQAIFDSWPLEEMKKRFRYVERTTGMQICSYHNCIITIQIPTVIIYYYTLTINTEVCVHT